MAAEESASKVIMEGETKVMKFPQRVGSALSETPWPRSVAAGTLVAGAILLICGKRRSGIAVAAAGAAVALLENPQAIKDAWEAMPRLMRSSHDFLARIEDFVDELNKQGIRVRSVLSQQQ